MSGPFLTSLVFSPWFRAITHKKMQLILFMMILLASAVGVAAFAQSSLTPHSPVTAPAKTSDDCPASLPLVPIQPVNLRIVPTKGCLHVTTDKPWYSIGEPIHITLTYEGPTVTITVHSVCNTHLRITSENGSQVYGYGEVCIALYVNMNITLTSGEVVGSFTWDQTSELGTWPLHQVPPGTYTIIGTEVVYTGTTRITIVSDGQCMVPGGSNTNVSSNGQDCALSSCTSITDYPTTIYGQSCVVSTGFVYCHLCSSQT